ncbi:MAG: C4-dicarboxylate transporter [Rubritepida sp.]|nr:C4-dicarboxylate transporter [Rubritepida sp.]
MQKGLADVKPLSLAYFPLPLLAAPMGLGGLGLAWRQMATADAGWVWAVGEVLMALTVLSWIVIVGLHAARAVAHPGMLRDDWLHPFRGSFTGAVSIGLMLVAATFIPYLPGVARALLIAAILLHWAIGLAILSRVLRGEGSAEILAPPLLIPLVGNIVATIFCVPLGLGQLGWMLFGIGGLLWLGVQPLLLGRIFAGPPPAPVLRPALFILLAPPAVGALAIGALNGQGPFVWALYGFAAFTLALLLTALRYMMAGGFNAGFWAFTFPLAAFSVSTTKIAPGWIGAVVLALATVVIGTITLRTAHLAWKGAFFRAP